LAAAGPPAAAVAVAVAAVGEEQNFIQRKNKMTMIENQKYRFDIPDDVTYLDCAAQSPALKVSYDAGLRGLNRKLHPWDPERANLNREIIEARALFGELVGSAGENIALMTATSYGAAIAAANLSLQTGQNIVLLEDQFPSNYYCWEHMAARDDGNLTIVPRPTDGDWTTAVLSGIDRHTGIVALPNCHWTDGGRLDLERIAVKVHDVGAAFVIDATQSIGTHTFDVRKLDPDFVACSAYKWLLSPDSAGFLYVADRHLEGRPLEDNHAGRIGESSMEVSAGYGQTYRAGALRFDQGAADNMVYLPMCVTAMAQILDWGVENIAASLRPVTDKIASEAEQRGMTVPPRAHRVSHFIGLYPIAMPVDLVPFLKSRGIHVSLRGGAIRVSPHLFNDLDDVEKLFAALDAICDY